MTRRYNRHPTLCVRTGGSNDSSPLTANVQLASREIPVLLLDSQKREELLDPVTQKKIEVKEDIPETIDINEEHESRSALVHAAIVANTARQQEIWKAGTINAFDHHVCSKLCLIWLRCPWLLFCKTECDVAGSSILF
eukprot:SAG31_NODE_936_length_10870_cov_5.136966_4_plen_138_part_00